MAKLNGFFTFCPSSSVAQLSRASLVMPSELICSIVGYEAWNRRTPLRDAIAIAQRTADDPYETAFVSANDFSQIPGAEP